MKLFERITFPTAAVYNIQTKIEAKIKGNADVNLIRNEENEIKTVCDNLSDKQKTQSSAVVN